MSGEHYSQIPPKPLIAGMSQKSEPTENIFFFERSDGKIIVAKEQEAWGLYSRRQQVLGKNKRVEFKLVGVGDGRIFADAVNRAKVAGQTNITEAQDIIRKGQDEELEACRGKIVAPRDMDKIG